MRKNTSIPPAISAPFETEVPGRVAGISFDDNGCRMVRNPKSKGHVSKGWVSDVGWLVNRVTT
jgi:hypothetical protein